MTRLGRLADLRLDGGTQPRAAIDEAVVAEYATTKAAVLALLAAGLSQSEAARKIGVSRQRVNQILANHKRRYWLKKKAR